MDDFVCFDLECSNLNGNFGRILCGSFTPVGGTVAETYGSKVGLLGNKMADDAKTILDIKNKLEDSWVWVSWNGKLFDIPFLNARLLIHGYKPVEKRLHIDLMYYARGQFMRIHSSRLDAVAQTFKIKSQKTLLVPDIWVKATLGDREAMNYVVEHCEHDVFALSEIFPILKPFIANIHK
jgi:uncharacterized protein YprB with RNaseH-like and TPR domain